MKTFYLRVRYTTVLLILLKLAGTDTFGQAPVINSLKLNGQLTWTYGYDAQTNHIARLETSPDLWTWHPIFYDFVSTNVYPPTNWPPPYYTLPTHVVRTNLVSFSPTNGFFRIAVQTNIPDPTLVLHLSFDDNFTNNGIVLDESGYGNHGFQYQTNRWPSTTIGPDGSQAALFHIYSDPFFTPIPANGFGVSGDYIVIKHTPELDYLTNATIAVWADYFAYDTNAIDIPWDTTLISAGGADVDYSWTVGRLNSGNTFFSFGTRILGFPDDATAMSGDSGGWHYYVLTFDGTTLKGYYQGTNFVSVPLPGVSALRLGGTYIGIGCWNHDGTPQLYDDDGQPNIGWITGAVDDIRIYRRTLNDAEVLALFSTFDHQPPTVPTGLQARAAASSQIELRWTPATDAFYLAGYTIRRNGAVVGTASSPMYVDTGLAPSTQYTYTIDAFDGAGNHSVQSLPLVTNTPASGSPIQVIVDDSDGAPWVSAAGSWAFDVGYVGSLYNSFHFGRASTGGQSVTLRPNLPQAGTYAVYLWYGEVGGPSVPTFVMATDVPVNIVTGGVTNTVIVNQQINFANWYSLGSYSFSAGTNNFVRIGVSGDQTTSYTAADAVMFVK
jgi:hypothetical protein